MAVTQVFISDELIDLQPGQAVALSYQVNNIADIKNQRANFTNIFRAPRTKDNDRKFGFAADLNSTDKRPYRILPARVLVDGEDVVVNGYAVIKKVDKFYNILIYSGLFDLYAKIGERKLSDLDLSAFDHQFSKANIQALLPATSGICYPIINYGQFNISTAIADYLRFAIYCSEIFERILTDAGFDFAGSFFDHVDYNKLLLPFTNEKQTNKSSAVLGSFEAEVEDYHNTTPDTWHNIPFTVVTKGNGAGCFDGSIYTVGAYAVRGKFSFVGNMSDTWGATQNIALQIVSSTKGIIAYNKFANSGFNINLKLDTVNLDFEAGETLTLQWKFDQTGGDISGTFKFTQDNVVPFNGWIPVAENLPDLKQKDFLKAIAQMYGLIFDIDLDSTAVRVRFFDDLHTNKAYAKDWSGKLDLGKGDTKTFILDFAQNNNFFYNNGSVEGSEDSQLAASTGNVPYSLGRSILTIDNTTLPLSKDAANLPFAATEEENNTSVLPFDKVLKMPYIKIYEGATVEEILYGPSGIFGGVANTQPWIYSETFYAAVANYSPTGIYGTPQRVRYNGTVWEWVSSDEDLALTGQTPGIAFDKADDGTNYTGSPVWKPVAIEDTFLFSQKIKVKPRILLATSITQSITFKLEQIDDEFSSSYLIIPTFAGLDFETLLTNHYKVITDTVNDTKVVRTFFNLTPVDIKSLDHLIPVYVSYYNNFFYISLIEKFQQGQSTAVELIKI